MDYFWEVSPLTLVPRSRHALPKRKRGGENDDALHTNPREGDTPQFEGVTSDDLPIANRENPRRTDYYRNLPVLRKLDWRTDHLSNPKRRDLKDSTSLLAAFVQTRGRVVSDPCLNCQNRRGPWQSCVVGSDTTEDQSTHGACANCRFGRRSKCSLRSNREEDYNGQISSLIDNDALSISSVDDAGIKGELFESRKISEAHKAPNRTEKKKDSTPSTSSNKVMEDKHEHDITEGLSRRFSYPSNNRMVIEFPLGPETFNDLPLLTQAVEDLTMHLDVIKNRVHQLKEREKEWQVENPWDLVNPLKRKK